MKGSTMLRSLPTTEERRGLTLTDAAVTVQPDAAGFPRFGGHAAVFSSRTAIGNPLTYGFYEEVAPGAFTKTLAEGDARMLVDHNSAQVVSRVSAGTLGLSQDARGLAVDSTLDTGLSYVNDLIANMRNGNITGMSFGFRVIKDDWVTEEARAADGTTAEVEVRTIREAQLLEVSAVTFPAYEDTDAGLRDSLVTALRHRGDVDAVARRARWRPELAQLLDEMPPAAGAYSPNDFRELEQISTRPGAPRRFLAHPVSRSAIPAHATEVVTHAWNAATHAARLPAWSAPLMAAHAYIDPGADQNSMSSYRFLHHHVNPDGTVGAANAHACAACIAGLNNMYRTSMQVTTMTASDRRGVYNHVAQHLRDAGQTPEELEPGPEDEGPNDPELPDEPAVTTHGADLSTVEFACTCGRSDTAAVEVPEPAASTRHTPTTAQAAKAELLVLSARFGLPAA